MSERRYSEQTFLQPERPVKFWKLLAAGVTVGLIVLSPVIYDKLQSHEPTVEVQPPEWVNNHHMIEKVRNQDFVKSTFVPTLTL